MPISFIVYDLIFLVLFTLAVVLFLYKRRQKLQRQGLLYLYRTRVGIKFIEWTSRRFPKTLYYLQYVVVVSGYALMISMIYLLIRFSWAYLTSPTIAEQLKVPVVIPLVPYLPELFNLDFLPPFFFTYWIIIIAIIAIPHEFAHGIFARLNKIRIHSTGFGFLGPFLAAFVEPDEKQMEKSKKFPQLSILAGGTFANVVFTILFAVILFAFFAAAFTPAGVNFLNVYSTKNINISEITAVNGVPVNSPGQIKPLISSEGLTTVSSLEGEYQTSSRVLNQTLSLNLNQLAVFENTPAFDARLAGDPLTATLETPRIAGAITEIEGAEIKSSEDLRREIEKYSPGDEVTIKVVEKSKTGSSSLSNLFIGEEKEFTIAFGEREGDAFIGIFLIPPVQQGGLISTATAVFSQIKNPQVYYSSNIGGFGIFIYDLLWWVVVISISVALVNMLPLGIFDGGRFFYLTVWGITGSQTAGAKAFKFSTYFILFLILALMIKWLFIFV